MAATPSLEGLRVVVTRPADGAEPICRMLENHGASVVRLPMQAIEPTRQPAAAAKSLQQARDAQAWIFTSANAVQFARSLDAGVWPPCVAVGPATAAALERSGIGAVLVPAERHDSEGVLALPELQDVLGKRILIVTGEGGRDAIESGLAERGALVERVDVYRRVALPHAPEALAQAVAGADAAIVTNGEALQLLAERMPAAARPALLGLQLVVPSRRVVEQAREIGFTAEPLVPEQLADAGYLRSLEQWWRTARRDARMMRDNEVRPQPAADAPALGAPDEAGPLPDAAPTAPAPEARFPWIGLLASVLILALLAAAGWEGYRRAQAWLDAQDQRVRALAESLNAAEAQIDRLQTRVSDQAVAVQRNAADQARFADRLDAQDEAIGRLREQLGAGRARVQLALVEQLLMLANERVQVGRDVDAAIVALEAADARLAELR
ncbi:MAG: uroporphyrinogen-III synthase, partial [Gammaproteobacteria bacterium]